MEVAVVGCGFSSYLYGGTFGNHPSLRIVGAYDRQPQRTAAWCQRFRVQPFDSFEDLLASPAELVVNLTNPGSHYDVTAACLEAGKHVYSEKPLAIGTADSARLVAIAKRAGLRLGCAPCSLLGETAQTLGRAIASGIVGRVHTAHVMLSVPHTSSDAVAAWVRSHRQGGLAAAYARDLDVPVAWPYADEFEVGPAYEHAAYALKWLTSWFGPVTRLVNYSSSRVPQKYGWDYLRREGVGVVTDTSDLYVSCLSLADGVEVLMINATVMSDDLQFVLHGEKGSLEVASQWDFACPVWVRRPGIFMPAARFVYPHAVSDRFARRYPRGYRVTMDYARGVAELARAIESGKPARHVCNLAQEIHIQEITDHIATARAAVIVPETTFDERPVPKPLPREVGIGVVGDAPAAETYVSALQRSDACRLIAAAGPSAPAGEMRGPERPAAGHEEALMLDKRVHAILNVAEAPRRAKLTSAYLRAGKHVFSAEPFASTPAEARAIRDVANEFGLRMACAAPRLVTQQVRRLANGLKAGDLGEINAIVCETSGADAADVLANRDVVAACLWIATWVIGPVWRVRANSRAEPGGAVATFTFVSGATLELREKNDQASDFGALELKDEPGTARVSFAAGTASLGMICAAGSSATRERVAAEAAGHSNACREAVEFCEAIREGALPPQPLEHAVHQILVRELLETAVHTGREVALKETFVQGAW